MSDRTVIKTPQEAHLHLLNFLHPLFNAPQVAFRNYTLAQLAGLGL